MRGRSKGPSRKGPSKTPADKREKVASIAAEYGVKKARPGQGMDERVAREAKAEKAPLYLRFAGAVGQDRLDAAEKALFFALAGFFSFFLMSGLAISSIAAYKAAGTPVPVKWDAFVTSVEGLFTPSLFFFFAGSSVFGLYKQAQLNAGVTGYTERGDQ